MKPVMSLGRGIFFQPSIPMSNTMRVIHQEGGTTTLSGLSSVSSDTYTCYCMIRFLGISAGVKQVLSGCNVSHMVLSSGT